MTTGQDSWQAVGVLDSRGCFVLLAADPGRWLGGAPPRLGVRLAELLDEPEREALRSALARLSMERAEAAGGSPAPMKGPLTFALRGPPSGLVRLTALVGANGLGTLVEVRAGAVAPGGGGPAAGEGRAGDRDRQSLRYQLPELQAVLSALPDLYFRFDAEGRFIDCSAPITSELYVPPEAFLGKRPHEVMPPELAEAMERVRAEVHASGGLSTIEYELELGGSRRQYEARYVPFLDGQTMAIVRNVTEQRRAERALLASEARLRDSQKVEAVGRLAGGVAHDFNNLLMVIAGYTSVVSRHVREGHPAAEAAEELVKAVQRGTALTKQLLALSRHQSPQRAVIDPEEVLRDMHNLLARVIGESIELRTRVEPEVGRIFVDRSGLEQVILNLVLNARDAMPRGGALSVEAVRSTLENGQPAVAIRVTDTGSGMDEETQARMFEPFFTTKAHGTGLGLFMVGNVARESGGSVDVVSQEGSGTTVSVHLPVAEGAHAPARAAGAHPLPRGSETILLVEDEDVVRRLLVDQLRHLGYQVIAAADGGEALERLSASPAPVALLLTDIVLPGFSGWELATRVHRVAPACRVLYMSGHVLDDGGEPNERLAPGNLIEKPFSLETLAARIRQTLASSPP